LFGFMILKVLVVAKGDLSTALGILKAAGPAPVLVGTLVSGLPTLAAVAGVLAVYAWRHDPGQTGRSGWEKVDAYWPLVASFLLGVFFAPGILFAASLAVAALAGPGLQRYRARPSRERRHDGRFLDTGLHILVAVLVAALAAVALYQMWLPHESLTLRASPTAQGHILVGSVLEESGDWMTVLVSGRRTLVRVRASTVENRVVCTRRQSYPVAEESVVHWLQSVEPTRRLLSFLSGAASACPKSGLGVP
jgi:hypothetical protein